MIYKIIKKISGILGEIGDSNDDVGVEIDGLFKDITTHPAEAENQGDDWLLLNDSYRRFLVVYDLPAVINLSKEEKPNDKIPHHVGSSYYIDEYDTSEIESNILLYSSLLHSRHRMQLNNEKGTSKIKRFDQHALRQARLFTKLRNTDYSKIQIYFDLSADSKDSLEVLTNWVLTELRDEGITIEPIRLRKEEALDSLMPSGSNKMNHTCVFDTDTGSEIIMYFTTQNKQPNEEYAEEQFERLEKYILDYVGDPNDIEK